MAELAVPQAPGTQDLKAEQKHIFVTLTQVFLQLTFLK